MRVYISGAITNTDDHDIRFKRAEQELIDQGHTPFNPERVGRAIQNNINFEMQYDDYMAIDEYFLKLCDAIYMLKGFDDSPGAREERAKAIAWGEKVLYEEDFESGRDCKNCSHLVVGDDEICTCDIPFCEFDEKKNTWRNSLKDLKEGVFAREVLVELYKGPVKKNEKCEGCKHYASLTKEDGTEKTYCRSNECMWEDFDCFPGEGEKHELVQQRNPQV